MVGSRLDRDDDEVARADGPGVRRGGGNPYNPFLAFVADGQPIILDGFEVSAGKTVYFMSGFREQGGIPSSDGSRSDDANLHGRPWGRRTEVWRASASFAG